MRPRDVVAFVVMLMIPALGVWLLWLGTTAK